MEDERPEGCLSRYMTLEGLKLVSDDPLIKLPSATA